MSVRLFVALEPSELVRQHLAAVQEQLRRSAGRECRELRWVPAENLHLNLQFLGGVREKRVDEVRAAVRGVAEEFGPLDLEVHGAGGFPTARQATVVWAGVGGRDPGLGRLAATLRRRLGLLGFPPGEHAFIAHVALGRARYPYGVASLAGALWRASCIRPVPWRADELVLFRSHLSTSGPRYEALMRFALAGARASAA
jgi:2'-5' RNA ligase